MTTTEKIKHASPKEIRLYKEGVFWVGYEQSAYWLHLHKGYKASIGKYCFSEVAFPACI